MRLGSSLWQNVRTLKNHVQGTSFAGGIYESLWMTLEMSIAESMVSVMRGLRTQALWPDPGQPLWLVTQQAIDDSPR